MQSDQKVGLALGVLLIGVVAAFFFRNEPDPALNARTLENAAEIDREISEKRLTPYFSGIESDEPDHGAPARPVASSKDRNDHRTGERKLPRWEDALNGAEHDPFAAQNQGTDVPAPAPDPIRYEETIAADSQTRSAAENHQAWKPADDGSAHDAAQAPDGSTARRHEVQRGETLSSIAGKYLGSQARFHEIFSANRDQLQDANDLKVGMKLRIPDAAVKPSSGKTSQETRVKKPPEPKSIAAPPLAAEDWLKSAEEVEAVPIGTSESEKDNPPEHEPPASIPAEPGKIKFSPAKRRPARTGGGP